MTMRSKHRTGAASGHEASGARAVECDAVVLGGGAMGLFSAFYLALAGKSVVVLERALPWSEASAVNAGSLAVQNKRSALVPLSLESLRIWATLPEVLGAELGLRKVGGYRVATTAEERAELCRAAEVQAGQGVRLEWVEGTELRDRVPYLSREVLAATYSPDDCYASPLRVGPALLAALSSKGVQVWTHASPLAIRCDGSRVEVHTGAGVVRAARAVIAAGAWTNQVVALLELSFPLAVDINMVSVTDPAPALIGHIVTHIRGILTLKQTDNGTCLIGGGWQGEGSLESGVKELGFDSFVQNLDLACRVVPGLRRLNLVRQWAGFEGVTPDSLPLFGPLPEHPEVVVCACARGGWTLSPVFGRMTADLITGRDTSFDVSTFTPARFARRLEG